ncbi:MAG: GDSL-type esterase/lipase family protein [Nocardioides sp.]
MGFSRSSVVLASLVLGLAVAIPVQGAEPTSTPSSLDVVVLGDSYSAGNGAGSYTEPTDCYRSSRNWAARYTSWLKTQGYLAKLTNRACSGGVTAHFENPRVLNNFAPQQTGRCLRRSPDERVRFVDGRCESSLLPQVEAITPETDLVLFTFGGNDLGFSTIVRDCLEVVLREANTCKLAIDAANAKLDALEADLTLILFSIRKKLHPGARVLLAGYPQLIGAGLFTLPSKAPLPPLIYDAGAALRKLGDEGRIRQRGAVATVNAAAGEPFVTYVDAIEPFSTHEPNPLLAPLIPAGNPQSWIWEEDPSRDRNEWYHPNNQGHTAYANLLKQYGDLGVTTPSGIWKDVSAGWRGSCGIKPGGTGWCWGDNEVGQLGDGTTTGRLSPVQVPGIWKTITAGASHWCGVKTNGTGWCWGYNQNGQLGDGTTTLRLSPTQVPGNWKTITAGAEHSCGVKTNGTGWCWGYNGSGQLGNGGTATLRSLLPVQVPGNWTAITTAAGQSCGLKTDGTGWCWGSNYFGGLGNENTTDSFVPVRVPGAWSSITAGYGYSCGLKTDGTGWCWGRNDGGELGDGTTINRSSPVQVPGSWSKIVPGTYHSCGLKPDGTWWCWGYNSKGQLGDGTITAKLSPIQVPGTWTNITPGSQHSCGVKPDTTGWCWGWNPYGQLGDGTDTDRFSPTPIT